MPGVDEPRASHWQAAKAVFWSFFGVRKSADYEHDALRLTPVQIIVLGLIGAAVFVLSVLGVVILVTR